MLIDEEDYLAHYGTLHRSGRYPWGTSGWGEGEDVGRKHVSPRSMNFVEMVEGFKAQGFSDKEIMKAMNMTSTELRTRRTIANNEIKQAQIIQAQAFRDKGNSPTAIGRRMNIPEPTVRTLLAPGAADRTNVLISTANMLRKEVEKKKIVDVGSGVEAHLNISKENLRAAVKILEDEGYSSHSVPVPQPGRGQDTTTQVLVPPGVTQKDAFLNRDKIQQIPTFSPDGGHRYGRVDHPPISVHPDRIAINYKEDGGGEADGVILVRPGVDDIALGKNRYAQVRVLVGDSHYIKGMAMYNDNLPKGVDLLFNTAKSDTGNKLDALKPIEKNSDYPFGSVVKQIVADPGGPNERNVSAMNIVNEQGDWHKWARTMSSQVLSKQKPELAQQQLDVTYDSRLTEFDEISNLTNPTIKKKLLTSFADQTDKAAVHLKAAALPSANWHTILPLESVKPDEIYAPNYNNGEQVVLLRYPHGGTFEIPQLKVNNRNAEGQKFIGSDSIDAVGIHHSVAQRLSGADFDGDTVLVIPNNKGTIQTSHALEELKTFDPQMYKLPADSPIKRMTKSGTQIEMGKISNLITDMTIKGAPHSDLVRAIKHSMVVIDAEKHGLNYRESARRNGISALKTEYQGGPRAGASTLISRKKSEDRNALDRKPRPHGQGGPIDESGRKVFVPSGKMRRDRQGNLVPKRTTIVKLAETTDAHTLSSGTKIESIYAEHSNRLKDLANKARLEASKQPLLKRSPSAAVTYAREVESLKSKLKLVEMNRPRERQALVIAGGKLKAIYAANPQLEENSKKKIRFQEIERARERVGSQSRDLQIKFTDREWNAIQAGAISDNTLKKILEKADIEDVRRLATPRQQPKLTTSKIQLARDLLASGATRAEVAQRLGVSVTTLDNATG